MLFSIYPIYSLLTSTLILGSLISISTNSIFLIWVGLEINLISFLPLILLNQYLYSSISAIKYFLTQSIASIILLLSFLSQIFINYRVFLLLGALLVKSGLPPYHFWFPSVIQSINWISCIILSTWQKLAPLLLLIFSLFNSLYIIIILSLSIYIRSIGGYRQTKLRSLLAYSSIGHISWILRACLVSSTPSIIYLIFYIILSLTIFIIIYFISISSTHNIFKFNLKISLTIVIVILLFSLRGLPPFIGFFPKWIVIEFLIKENLFLTITLICSSIINLSYYLNLTFCFFFLSSPSKKFFIKSNILLSFLIILSLISIPNIFIYAMTILY